MIGGSSEVTQACASSGQRTCACTAGALAMACRRTGHIAAAGAGDRRIWRMDELCFSWYQQPAWGRREGDMRCVGTAHLPSQCV